MTRRSRVRRLGDSIGDRTRSAVADFRQQRPVLDDIFSSQQSLDSSRSNSDPLIWSRSSVPAGNHLVVPMRSSSTNLPLRHLPARLATFVLIGLVAHLLLGCSAMRKQIAERRAACHSLCQQARTAKDEGCPDQADLLLNEAVRQRPDDLETRRHLAEAMWDCGRAQDAIDEYRQLSQIHSRDARLSQRLAVMLWTTGQKDAAAQAAEQAIRQDPDSAEALLVRARVQVSRQDFDGAVATYIRLSRVAPDLLEARLELAEAHVLQGNSQQACALLREILSRPSLTVPQKADVEWKLGLSYASADRWTDATQHLGNSIETRNASATDWQFLMAARMMAGQDSSDLQAKAVQASSHQAPPDTSAWTALRDRLLIRSTMTVRAGGTSSSDVISADFSRP